MDGDQVLKPKQEEGKSIETTYHNNQSKHQYNKGVSKGRRRYQEKPNIHSNWRKIPLNLERGITSSISKRSIHMMTTTITESIELIFNPLSKDSCIKPKAKELQRKSLTVSRGSQKTPCNSELKGKEHNQANGNKKLLLDLMLR